MGNLATVSVFNFQVFKLKQHSYTLGRSRSNNKAHTIFGLFAVSWFVPLNLNNRLFIRTQLSVKLLKTMSLAF